MANKIDDILNAMSPADLAALESEVDKRAEEQDMQAFTEYHLGMGVKLAQDVMADYLKTGTLHPLLHLVKAAAGGIKNLPPEAKAKFEANKKNPPGPAGGPGHGSQKMSEVDDLLSKCSAKELAEFEAKLDVVLEKKASGEFATRYLQAGQKMAQHVFNEKKNGDLSKEGAAPLIAKMLTGFGGMFARGGAVRKALAPMARTAKKYPGASAIGVGAGGMWAGQKLLS